MSTVLETNLFLNILKQAKNKWLQSYTWLYTLPDTYFKWKQSNIDKRRVYICVYLSPQREPVAHLNTWPTSPALRHIVYNMNQELLSLLSLQTAAKAQWLVLS